MSTSFLGNIKIAATIGELSKSHRYKQHLIAIQNALHHSKTGRIGENPFIHSLEEDPDYQLVMKSNQIIQDIDEEIVATYRFVTEIYVHKFPELESLIANRIDYIKVVRRIGNEMDLTLVNLSDLLSSQTVMVVTVSASTTAGKPLSDTLLKDCLSGCEEILKLYKEKNTILDFIQSRINKIAPNLCVLIGSLLTAQLIGLAGGLIPLSKIPGCNIMVMGQPKKNLMGLSNHSTMPHAGILSTSDVVTNAPPPLKKKMLKTIANKVALAARMDAYPTLTPVPISRPSASTIPAAHHQPITLPTSMPPPPPRFLHPNTSSSFTSSSSSSAVLPHPVPVPISTADKEDEKTEPMQDADYDNEDEEEEEEEEGSSEDEAGSGEEGMDTTADEAADEAVAMSTEEGGMVINSDGGSKLRLFVENKLEKLQEPNRARTKKALPIPEERKKARRGGKRIRKMKEKMMLTDTRKQQNQMKMTVTDGEYGESAMGLDQGMVGMQDGGLGRIRAPKKTQQTAKFLQTKKVIQSAKALSSGATGGMSSSLVFTPVQGLELVNPNAAADRVREANQKWFHAQSGFLSAMPKTH